MSTRSQPKVSIDRSRSPAHSARCRPESIIPREEEKKEGSHSAENASAYTPRDRFESLYDGLLRYHEEQLDDETEEYDEVSSSEESFPSHSSDQKPFAVEAMRSNMGSDSPTGGDEDEFDASLPLTSDLTDTDFSTTRRNREVSSPLVSYPSPVASQTRSETHERESSRWRSSKPRGTGENAHSTRLGASRMSPMRDRSRPRPPSLHSTQSPASLKPGFVMTGTQFHNVELPRLGTLEMLSIPASSHDNDFDEEFAEKLQLEEGGEVVYPTRDDALLNGLNEDVLLDSDRRGAASSGSQCEREGEASEEVDQLHDGTDAAVVSLLDDEELARRLQDDDGSQVSNSLHEDEELARRLQECEEPDQRKSIEAQDDDDNAQVSDRLKEDEELARRLQECEDPDQLKSIEAQDEELARKWQEEEKQEEERRRSRMMTESIGHDPFTSAATSSLQGFGTPEIEEVQEQLRILERIRMEQERQQVEWAMRDSPRGNELPIAGAMHSFGPRPQHYGVPPRHFGVPPPRESWGPPPAQRDYAVPQRSHLVPPQNYMGPPPRQYAPVSRDSTAPPEFYSSFHDFAGPRQLPYSESPRHYVAPPHREFDQRTREFQSDRHTHFPPRDVRGMQASPGWRESQQHALSEYSTIQHPPPARGLPPVGSSDFSHDHSMPLSQQEAQRRHIVRKGQEETVNAIRAGQSHAVVCRGCNARLQAPIDYSLVYCPCCGCVSPGQNTSARPRTRYQNPGWE